MQNSDYELVIIGGGPAGLTAGIYAGRARLQTLLLEKGAIGGLIATSDWVESYPGFPDGISGFNLTELMHNQAIKYGAEIEFAEVNEITQDGLHKIVMTSSGNVRAKAVIIASGSEVAKLNVAGEDVFTGKGVSYCATCDGPLFKDKVLAVVGGGDSALTEAVFLTRFASRVFVIHRRDQLRASRALQEKAAAEPKITFVLNSIVTGIMGKETVEQLQIKNVKDGRESELKLNGIFVSVGFKPNTGFLQGAIKLDEVNRIIVDDGGNMETSMTGVYAAGDIRHNSVRQVIAAAGDGAVAALTAEKYIRL